MFDSSLSSKNQTQQQKSKQTNKKIKQGKNDNLTEVWLKKCILETIVWAAEAVLVMHKKSTTTVKLILVEITLLLSYITAINEIVHEQNWGWIDNT